MTMNLDLRSKIMKVIIIKYVGRIHDTNIRLFKDICSRAMWLELLLCKRWSERFERKGAVKHCGTSRIWHAGCRKVDKSVKRIFTTQRELAVTLLPCSVNKTEIGNKSYTRDVRSYSCCSLWPDFKETVLGSGGKSKNTQNYWVFEMCSSFSSL
jgi:hypothetical protein